MNDLYNVYLESQCYKKDLNEIFLKNGKNIGILYEFVSKNLLFYYRYNKSKTQRKEDDKEICNDNNEDNKEKNVEGDENDN